jgi:hypothetical protein
VPAVADEGFFLKGFAVATDNQEYHLNKSLWVTVVPEIKNFFMGQACPPTKERVRQKDFQVGRQPF